jgi:hypothetical protein
MSTQSVYNKDWFWFYIVEDRTWVLTEIVMASGIPEQQLESYSNTQLYKLAVEFGLINSESGLGGSAPE